MPLVSVKYVPSYDEELLYNAVSEHFENLGASEELKPGLRVLIKPNLLAPRKPDTAVTTHHALLASVIRYLKARGVSDIVVADSSAGPYINASLKAVYSAAGYLREDTAPYLNYDLTYKTVECPEKNPSNSFNIITPVLDADYIINLPKLKTHSMTTFSGGVKNLFGVIPGLQKPDMHRRFPTPSVFCSMLCQLCTVVAPSITIMDAIDSMEGNGPGGGTVKHTGLTLASKDAFSLDTVAADFMGVSPENAPLLIEARKMGLVSGYPELCGDSFSPFPEPFVLPDTVQNTNFTSSLPKPIRKVSAFLIDGLLRSYPRVDPSACVACGKCAESCPQKIISLATGKAKMPRRGCISCFCCQEVCPAHAIYAKRILDK